MGMCDVSVQPLAHYNSEFGHQMAGLTSNFSLGPQRRMILWEPVPDSGPLEATQSSLKDRIPLPTIPSLFKQGSQLGSPVLLGQSHLVTLGLPSVCSLTDCRKLSFQVLFLSGEFFSQGLGVSYAYNTLVFPPTYFWFLSIFLMPM